MRYTRICGVAAAAALALTGIAACGGSSTPAASKTNAAGFVCPSGGIKFAVEPYEDASTLIPVYKTVASALQTSLKCKVDLQITESYAAEIVAMENGKVDIGEFGPLGYVLASEQADAIPLTSFATANGKLSTYTAGIWVPASSSIKTLTDLKGKSLALSEVGSTSGDAEPRYALEAAGVPLSSVKMEYAGGHPQSLLALTNGKVDAGEINSQEEATAIAAHQFNPKDYREIWKSAPIPNDPITVWGKEPIAFQNAVKKALLGLSVAQLKKVDTELDVTPPGPLLAVSKSNYAQLFSLAKDLHITPKYL